MYYTALGICPQRGKDTILTKGGQPCWGTLSEYAMPSKVALTDIIWEPQFTGALQGRGDVEHTKEIFAALFEDLNPITYEFLLKSKWGREGIFNIHIKLGDAPVQDTMARLFLARNVMEYGYSTRYVYFREKGYPVRESIMAAMIVGSTQSFHHGKYSYLSQSDECIHTHQTHVVDVRYFCRTGKLSNPKSDLKFSDGEGGYMQGGRMTGILFRPTSKGTPTLKGAIGPFHDKYLESLISEGKKSISSSRFSHADGDAFVEHLFGKPSKE